LVSSIELIAQPADYAGITVDKATLVKDTTSLLVQDGGNYIKLPINRLPATISYMSDSAFGPVPSAWVEGGDTLAIKTVFNACQQQWQWVVEEAEDVQIVAIAAHENAHITVEPTIGFLYNYIEYQECDSFVYKGKTYTASGDYALDTVYVESGDRQINVLRLTLGKTYYGSSNVSACQQYKSMSGKIYTESGVYKDTLPQYGGCYAIITLNLTIENCTYTDTIRFCQGEGTPHVEQEGDTIHYYLQYFYIMLERHQHHLVTKVHTINLYK